MRRKSLSLRATLLFCILVATSWFPRAAAEWLLDPPTGKGPALAQPVPESLPGELDQWPPSGPLDDRAAKEDAVQREVDLRGNEIVRPVGHYRVDPRGGLYELHSPDTELPRLPPPEM